MMNQKQISALFAKKVPIEKCEDLIEELLAIAYNKPERLPVKDNFGKALTDKKGAPVFQESRPHTTTAQLGAIRILADYAIGKPGPAEQEPTIEKGGGVVVILPSNGR